MKKKLLAALLSVAMLASMAGCGSDTSWIARQGDLSVNSGSYLYYGLNRYFEAMGKLSENDSVDKMFSKGVEIEGKDSAAWIKDAAIENVKELIAINEKFNEMGLEISDVDEADIRASAKKFHAGYNAMMVGNGISEESVYQTMRMNFQKNAIFEAYYHEGGEKAVPEADIIDFMNENRVRVKWIALQLKDGEGNLLKSDGKAEVKKMAEEYIQRAKDGEDFEALIDEYDEYYANLVAEATGEEPAEEDEETEKVYESVLVKDGTTPSEKVNKEIFEKAKEGVPVLIEDNEIYYVVMRYDLAEKEGYLDENRAGLIYLMKSDEFEETVAEWVKNVEFELNEKAFDKYDPKDFDLSAVQG